MDELNKLKEKIEIVTKFKPKTIPQIERDVGRLAIKELIGDMTRDKFELAIEELKREKKLIESQKIRNFPVFQSKAAK